MPPGERVGFYTSKNSIREELGATGWFTVNEEYVAGLPERFRTSEDLEVVRLGRYGGPKYRHPTDDRMIEIGKLFVYDPEWGEITTIPIPDGSDGTQEVLSLIKERCWDPVISVGEIVVGYKERDSKPSTEAPKYKPRHRTTQPRKNIHLGPGVQDPERVQFNPHGFGRKGFHTNPGWVKRGGQ